jgi:hypothetical protein
MTSAVGSRSRTTGVQHRIAGRDVADVFVVLGITCDLAKVMALHSLSKRDRGVPRLQRSSFPVYGRWHQPWVVT